MKQRYRLFRRRGGVFYTFDNATKKQASLKTSDRALAQRLLAAKNEPERQPAINMLLARTYYRAANGTSSDRTWQHVMHEMGKLKTGATQERWERAMNEAPFDRIRNLPLNETRGEHFLQALTNGTVSTNIFLRRLHNFSLDMNWLLAPIISRRQWPAIK